MELQTFQSGIWRLLLLDPVDDRPLKIRRILRQGKGAGYTVDEILETEPGYRLIHLRDYVTLQVIVEEGGSPDEWLSSRVNLLLVAVRQKLINFVDLLLRHGATITPLVAKQAFRQKNQEVILLLSQHNLPVMEDEGQKSGAKGVWEEARREITKREQRVEEIKLRSVVPRLRLLLAREAYAPGRPMYYEARARFLENCRQRGVAWQ